MRTSGGKGGNTVVAAARILGAKQAAIFGALGNDRIASEQVKILRQEGVEVSGLKLNSKAESGHAYIMVESTGENVVLSYPGANATITPKDLKDPTRRRLLSEAIVVTITNPPYEAAVELARQSKTMRKIVAWDPGTNAELGGSRVRELIKKIDYLFLNEFEAEKLTGRPQPDEAAAKLLKTNKELRVIIKLGSRGCIMHHQKKRSKIAALSLKSHGMRVVNTAGCGDAFLGAFVAALSEGHSDSLALRWGNCAGGLKAAKRETRGSPD